ncbi:AraC family transcriptional regulator [Herbiconiux sp. SYSU D00978]|uniref:AraC family transcriptional regulator n=1 Tax=Herbiconiux sp. SYSU D00978 TaxID=2812562 RepID=UPI001F601A86|nr:AraC family transcriptional regulator [Herbiconiux sp. SYSU D00978]
MTRIIHQDASTNDLHSADTLLRTLYGRASLKDPGPRRFRYRQKIDGDDRMKIARLRTTDSVEFSNELDQITIAQVSGDFRLELSPDRRMSPVQPTLVPRNVGHEGWGDDFDLLIVNLNPAAVAVFTDVRPEAESLINGPQDFVPAQSPESARLWCSTVKHVAREIVSNDRVMQSPLVRLSAFRLLTVSAIEAFGDRHRAVEPQAALPDAVRRARAFIDDNAHTAITVDDVARAARMSTRGLQWAFRRHLDSTPTEYLRRVRLEGARQDLLAADPDGDASVESIALRWGFAHSGRFAGYYQDAFHERPSATLKR